MGTVVGDIKADQDVCWPGVTLTPPALDNDRQARENPAPDQRPWLTANNGALEASAGNTYWWFRDGVLINGATSASYTPTQSGQYFARVSNGTCTRQTNAVEWLVVGGVAGCTYPIATNYNPNAQVDDGSCFFELNCNCPADFNQNGEIGVSDLLLFIEMYGSSCND